MLTNPDEDPYLSPGAKTPLQCAVEEEGVRAQLEALNAKYSSAWRCQGIQGGSALGLE